jgi:DNA-binding HxlR family transcriptional regulator
MRDEKFCNSQCPLYQAIGKVGNKWKPIIINVIQDKTYRFGQLDAIIPHITRKVLTEQLKELEEDGIVNRTSYKELPPRVEYTLTKQGKAFIPILEAIKQWNEKFAVVPDSETVSQ